jgi:cytochrome c oxidase subunit I+III
VAWLLALLARRWNRAGHTRRFFVAIGGAVALAVIGGLALVAGPARAGLDPTSHVYPATVWLLVGWTVLHVAVGVLMLAYCAVRRIAGRMTAQHDIDIHNVVLYWHFTAITVAITTLVIAGFPLVA